MFTLYSLFSAKMALDVPLCLVYDKVSRLNMDSPLSLSMQGDGTGEEYVLYRKTICLGDEPGTSLL